MANLPFKFLIARHKVTRKFVVIDTATWKPVGEHERRSDAEKFVSAALESSEASS